MATQAELIREIHATVGDLKNQLLSREYLDVMVKDHDEFINGNGRPGAKSQLTLIQNKLKEVQDYQKSSKGYIGMVIVAVIINIILSLLGQS